MLKSLLLLSFLGFILAVFLSSCSYNDETEFDNIETVKKFFEAFNNHDWEKMAGFYAEGAELFDPSYGGQYVKKTHRELVEKYSEMNRISPDINDNIIGIYADKNIVVVEFISTGSVEGGQRKWSKPICSVLELKDGTIIRDATYYDMGN